jgi:hypothetical protein
MCTRNLAERARYDLGVVSEFRYPFDERDRVQLRDRSRTR